MFFPTSFAIGTSSTLAMVWLMNVEMTCAEHNELKSHPHASTWYTHQDDERQEQDNGVEVHARNQITDTVSEDFQETAVCNAVPERDTTHSDEHHGPQELVEVILDRPSIPTLPRCSCTVYSPS